MVKDDLRARLAAYVREQADWRQGKATEYPDDERNVRSAGALRSLADHIESAPEAHPALLVLDSLQDHGLDRFIPSEEGARLIGRYGFEPGNPDPDSFLDELAVAESRDAMEQEEDR